MGTGAHIPRNGDVGGDVHKDENAVHDLLDIPDDPEVHGDGVVEVFLLRDPCGRAACWSLSLFPSFTYEESSNANTNATSIACCRNRADDSMYGACECASWIFSIAARIRGDTWRHSAGTTATPSAPARYRNMTSAFARMAGSALAGNMPSGDVI